MLSYELCLSLKDAGFPQDIDDGNYFYVAGEPMMEFDYRIRESKEELVKIPTLEELIESCMNKYTDLNFRLTKENSGGMKTNWIAVCSINKKEKCGYYHNVFEELTGGDTPEIAVANLYLTLKNNEKV